MTSGKNLTFALAGQPNVGKSTVFNMLTGLNQHVGNWPGKTIEQKTGVVNYKGYKIDLVDLPGTYSLTANSLEERIARDYLIKTRPNAVIAILNAATLEHSLYLLTELINLPIPIVIGLNMMDVAKQQGYQIEENVLSAALGNIPVVPIVATHNQGLNALLDAAIEVSKHPEKYHSQQYRLKPSEDPHKELQKDITEKLEGNLPPAYPPDWIALKLLEGDTEITAMVKKNAPKAWEAIEKLLMNHEDTFLDIASSRYAWIERLVRAAMTNPRKGTISLTDRLDKIATHPLAGLLMLIGISGGVFWVTYTLANPIVAWLGSAFIEPLAAWSKVALAGAPLWLQGLISDGIIGGAGMVLTFLPILFFFFTAMGFLEDVGYLTRAAYVMDRFMHWMGLHGRSFMPLFLGFGCNVPAIMGARIVEDRRARILTIMLSPLVPCTARMAVITFLAPAFFGKFAPLAVWGLISLNLIILALLGILTNKFVYKGKRTAFIMEIPLYHMPNPRTIGLFVWNNMVAFVRRAGTIILLVAIAMWWLSYYPNGNIEDSILANFGRWISPLGKIFGWHDWRITIALLTSFLAKENTIATLSVLYKIEASSHLSASIAQTLSMPGRLGFMAIQMLFIPCAATVAAIKKEAGTKWTIVNILLLLFISFSTGAIIYWSLTLLGVG